MVRRSFLLSLVFWAPFLVLVRVAVVPPEDCGSVDAARTRSAAVASAGWMERALQPDGRYVYEYFPDEDRLSNDYNTVRHAGVTMALYQAAGRYDDAGALAAADRATQWMIANLIEEDGWLALAEPDRSRAKLGSSALMLVALAERRLVTGDPRHDEVMRGLGRFLVAMQRDDGGFHVAWEPPRRAPDTVGTSRYYPGEALWALALLHEAFPDEGWDDAARSASTFLTTLRDEVEDVPFPPLPDHWTAYGLAEMVEWGLSDTEIEYARGMAERFSMLVRTEAQREDGALGTLVRGPESRAAGVGTWTEGLSAIWRLASSDNRLIDVRDDVATRLRCVAGILVERQATAEDAASTARPDLVEGAWFRDGETRMDDQQHAMSGLTYAADMIDGRVSREPEPAGRSAE